jgi:hypothetical protein
MPEPEDGGDDISPPAPSALTQILDFWYQPCPEAMPFENGAGNETRTRDPDLGKVVLYQLSYSR